MADKEYYCTVKKSKITATANLFMQKWCYVLGVDTMIPYKPIFQNSK